MAIVERISYPTQPAPLQELIDGLLAGASSAPTIEGEISAIIVPGSDMGDAVTAMARLFMAMKGHEFDTVVLISPSRTEQFDRITLCNLETYHTPLGALDVNTHIANELCDEDDDIFLDNTGHFHPQGIDVYLPYLQTIFESFDILPIVMGDESTMFCKELGHALGEVAYNRRVLIMAMSGVHTAEAGAFDELMDMLSDCDAQSAMELMNSDQIEVEGHGPLAVALLATMHRQSPIVTILDKQPPNQDAPGFVTAILTS